ncbi:amidase [Pseudonocardia benzenivorans]|uniref:Amidase n=2 Tax=Pseudonocardia TaxID=1847 RepID=F4CPP7_PSEUX|nr:amidase [Pseudonocardia dioxanivorans]AEA25164.1 Amidase [Pseudonocardia dioxanivorans CB1190]
MTADELCFLTAREMADLVRTGQVSAVELVRAHLDRIDAVNPAVNAIVTLVPEQALADAARADEARSAGRPLGPLHGIPVAHKDTHRTAGIRTTYGSRIFADHVPDDDELVVTRIRAAGAITIGKTNVPEFAAGSHTYNEVFGLTRNPYALDRSAGGSSGGAAAALACGMQPLADGNDMGGSLRNPASFCNVVGLRPTAGRVPQYPSVLPWSSLTVPGPMARSVDDLALLLSVIAGPDPRCPISLADDPRTLDGPLEVDLHGVRVAWAPDLGGAVALDPAVADVLARQVGVLEGLGCVVVEDHPDLSGADEVFRTLRAWQFQLAYGELLDAHRDLVKPSLAANIEAGRELRAEDVARAEGMRGELWERMHAFFAGYDVLVAAVSPVPPFDARLEYPCLPAAGDGGAAGGAGYLDWMRLAYWISATGCPALSVPAGFSGDGLPVGMQIVGPPGADRRVLEIGHMFETSTGHGRRRPPVVDATAAAVAGGESR